MTDFHSLSDPAESRRPLPTVASVAADEGLQLSCSSDACHINRSEFELITAGETGVASYAVQPNVPVERGIGTK